MTLERKGRFGAHRHARLSSTVLATFLTASMGAAQSSPVEKPTVFAPGVISELIADSSPSFFPDGNVVIFEHADITRSELRMSSRQGGTWSQPTTAPFSGRWWNLEPAVSADESYVIFVSARPASGTGEPISGRWAGRDHPERGGNLWRVDRRGEGWGEPVRLDDRINMGDAVFAPSLAADGTLFFEKPAGAKGKFKMFRARASGHGYAQAEPIRFYGDDVTESDPAIAPDQSYLLFVSDRETPDKLQLFISLSRDGRWSTPIRLPESINGPSNIVDPHLGPGGALLYFRHDRVIWSTPTAPILAWARETLASVERAPASSGS